MVRRVVTKGDEARDLLNLGNIALKSGKLDEADRYYQDSLDIFRAIGDEAGEASVMAGLGRVAWRREEFDDAVEYFEKALDGAPESSKNRPIVLHDLGAVEFALRDVEKAKRHVQTSLELFESLDDDEGKAAALNTLAVIDASREQFDEAEDAFQQSLGLRDDIGDVEGRARTYELLGTLGLQRAEPEQAVESFRYALEEYDALDDHVARTRVAHRIQLIEEYEGGENADGGHRIYIDGADDETSGDGFAFENLVTSRSWSPGRPMVVTPDPEQGDDWSPVLSTEPIESLVEVRTETSDPRHRRADDWTTKIQATIPTNAVTAWVLIEGLATVQSTAGQFDIPTWMYWGVFLVFMAFVPLHSVRQNAGGGKTLRDRFSAMWKDRPWRNQVVLATLAFFVWVYYLGGPFSRYASAYNKTQASVVLVIVTFLIIPMAIPEDGGDAGSD